MVQIANCDTLDASYGRVSALFSTLSLDVSDFIEGIASLLLTPITPNWDSRLVFEFYAPNYRDVSTGIFAFQVKPQVIMPMRVWIECPNYLNRYEFNFTPTVTNGWNNVVINLFTKVVKINGIEIASWYSGEGIPNPSTVGKITLSYQRENALYTVKFDDIRSDIEVTVPNGTLVINTSPVLGGALIDGVPKGIAPITTRLPPKSYVVSFEVVSGYTTPLSRTVDVYSNQVTSTLGTYTAIVPTRYTLNINSSPIGLPLLIVIGGEILSYITPFSEDIEIGTYRITLNASIVVEGITYNFVNWENGSTNLVRDVQHSAVQSISFNYVQAAPTQKTLRVDTIPVKGVIAMDGISLGIAPRSKLVDIGNHLVSYGAVSGYFSPPTETVNVIEDMDITRTYELIPTPTPEHSLAVLSNLTGFNIKITNISNLAQITGVVPWTGILVETTYDIEVPDVIIDPALPADQYYKLKSWEDNTTNRVRRLNLVADKIITTEYELLSIPPPEPDGISNSTIVATSVASGAIGYAVGRVQGAIIGGIIGTAGIYIIPKLVPTPTTQCIYCEKVFRFTTYNTSVWCPYCHNEQVVKKQVLRRG